jgi:hypothetical protein
MLDYTPDQLTWTNVKPRFQIQFWVQTNDKLIIKGLSNLARKPTESTGDLLNRVTDTMVIIRESYEAFQNKIKAPLNDANGRYLSATATKFFWAALLCEICNVVTQKDQTTITLDDMYRIATMVQRESSSKTAKTFTAVKEEEDSAIVSMPGWP